MRDTIMTEHTVNDTSNMCKEARNLLSEARFVDKVQRQELLRDESRQKILPSRIRFLVGRRGRLDRVHVCVQALRPRWCSP